VIARLRQPGGGLGTATVWLTALLALIGGAGVVALLVSLAADSTFWSDNDSDKWIGILFFGLALLGAVGFLVMDRQRALGAALAIVGGLSLALVLFWALLPILIGFAAVFVAIKRARALGNQPAPTG
jgi:hypothetical protein